MSTRPYRGWFVVLFGLALGSRALAGALDTDAPPQGAVSLKEAVAAALLHDPALAPYPFEIRAQEARTLQEGLAPNPVLATEVENFGRFGGSGTGVETTQTTVSLSQVLELGGKRGRRHALAKLDEALASWDYRRARLDAAARTVKAFAAGLVAQERVALAKVLVALACDGVGAVRRQAAAGAASPVEIARAETACVQAEAAKARRERELRAAHLALAATWGSPTPTFTSLVGALEPLAPPRALEELRAELERNPDVARFAAALERAQAAVGLELARRVPDVTVRVGSRRFVSAETNAFVAELSVPLPVFNRNQGAVADAYQRLGKTRAEERAVLASAEAALGAAYEELVAAFEQATALRERVLPHAQAAEDGTRREYAQGRLRSLDVLDAQRTVADVRGEHLEALARYHAAAADVERLTGMPATASVEEGQ